MTATAAEVLVDALAAYRLTRLVTRDTITEGLRRRVRADAGVGLLPERAGYFVTCPHCVGVWAGVFVVAARLTAPRLWDPVARALAAAAVVSLEADNRG